MRKSVAFVFLFFSGFANAIWAVHAGERPVLNVYTYDSFASKWGPGPQIKAAFETQCDCEVNYVAVDGSTGILSRVRLEGNRSRADVVLGLDNSMLVDAQKTGLLNPHNVNLANSTCRLNGAIKPSCPSTTATSLSSITATRSPNPPPVSGN